MPVVYWMLAWSPSLLVLLAILSMDAIVTGPLNPLMVAIRHERSQAHLRGRVFSAYSAIAMAASPPGVAATGYLIEDIGFGPTMLAIAFGLTALAVAIRFVPACRQMERSDAALATTDGVSLPG